MKPIYALLIFFLLITGCSTPSETVIYLMRHAEPDYSTTGEKSNDPELNAAGHQRAQALADLLKEDGITRVMSSDFQRTRQTAAPLAQALNMDVDIYNAFEIPAFADSLKGMTGRVVVVGHSNTTPKLVELLGGDPGQPIDESAEFDRLYTVTLSEDGSVTTHQSRYGN